MEESPRVKRRRLYNEGFMDFIYRWTWAICIAIALVAPVVTKDERLTVLPIIGFASWRISDLTSRVFFEKSWDIPHLSFSRYPPYQWHYSTTTKTSDWFVLLVFGFAIFVLRHPALIYLDWAKQFWAQYR